jgi:hypothetical protein
MIRTCARWIAGIFVLALCTSAQAQTLERYAGGARLADSPGDLTPVLPGELALGPDGGRIFVIHDTDGSIYRFDPVTRTATVMPQEGTEIPGWPPVFSWFNDLAVDDAGFVYGRQYGASIRVLDLTTGQDEFFANSDYYSQNTHCNGQPFYPARFGSVDDLATLPGRRVVIANGVENLVCILEQAYDPYGARASSRVLAGTGSAGFSGDGGPAYEATFNRPQSIATDAQGNVYVADNGNFRIRRFSAADVWMPGNIETIAGTGEEGFNGDGIPATAAQITDVRYLTVDAAGNLYFFDQYNRRVRRVDAASGLISTVAGDGSWDYAGADDGELATSAGLPEVSGLLVHPDGGLYVSERFNHRVRRVDLATGIVETVLGNGTMNWCGDGPRLKTCVDLPEALASDAQGNLFFADMGNALVRRIDAITGLTSTIAGQVHGVEFDDIGEFVSPEHGGDGGPATEATFGSGPYGVAVDAAGNVYIATGFDHRIRKVDAATGIITTIAGNGEPSSTGDGGPAANATVDMPMKIVLGPDGNLYFSEYGAHRIRKIDLQTGIISTVAGTGVNSGPLGDGGPATLAALSSPRNIVFDRNGDLLIADYSHWRLRKVNMTTGVISTLAGTGLPGSQGDGGPAIAAQMGDPFSIAVDAANNIFVTTGYRLRRIDAVTGVINRANASWGMNTSQGDSLQNPGDTLFDAAGNLFIADGNEQLIFRIPDLPLTPVDTTPPVITPVITGTLGNDGWYRGNVTVRWTASDPESAYEWPGQTCGQRTVTSDTAGVTFTCTTTSAGGVASQSVTIKRDATAPTLSFGTATPAADANGWRYGDVSVPFTTSDATSGVLSTSSTNPVVIGGSGTGLTQAVTVTDRAGNTATFTTLPVNIARTPVIEEQVTGTPGNNGWYRGDVQVSWSISNAPSIISSSGCDTTVVSSDTAGATLTCSVTTPGGASSRSVTIKRDATPPVLTFGTPSPAPNTNGWNKTNVSIPFTRSDAMSGLAANTPVSPLVLNTEGADVTGQVVVMDNAGNSAVYTSVARNIDKTAPVISFPSPEDGVGFGFYQEAFADYSCSDLALLSCTAPIAVGDYLTRVGGSRSLKVTAKDLAGFTSTQLHSFFVDSTFNWQGFSAPLHDPPMVNLVARGALVPIRWQLPDGHGGFVKNTAAFSSATVGSLSCGSQGAVPLVDTATGPAGIGYDAATQSFVYNWQTSASWTGCRKLTIKLKDNTTHEVRFRFQ